MSETPSPETVTRPLVRDHLIDLLYPSSCSRCGRAFILPLCPDCFNGLAAERHGGELDLRELPAPVAFESFRAAGDYAGAIKDMVIALKSSQRRLALPLAALMAIAAGNDPAFLNPWAVCFVPSRRDKVKERGYNPAGLLAARLASHAGRPLLDSLCVTREVADQDRTPGASRWENVSEAFDCRQSIRLNGPVLLVDDVLTTGATADACSRALLAGGATSVRVLVAARTVLRIHPKVHLERQRGRQAPGSSPKGAICISKNSPVGR
jgi:predicted amidophosphoribosyltransferase